MAVKESNDASAEDMDHVSESVSPQHKCQNLRKDSELNVTEGDDHSNCDSESESTTTEGESDEEIVSDENSSECEEDYSDDDAETEEEKDLEAPVENLDNNHSGSEGIVAEQLDIQVSVENQASTMEIYNTEALVDVYVTEAETEEEKDLEAPVLPIGFEKLENNHSGSEGIVAEQSDIQVSVENQASTMEIYNTEALVDVYVIEA